MKESINIKIAFKTEVLADAGGVTTNRHYSLMDAIKVLLANPGKTDVSTVVETTTVQTEEFSDFCGVYAQIK